MKNINEAKPHLITHSYYFTEDNYTNKVITKPN